MMKLQITDNHSNAAQQDAGQTVNSTEGNMPTISSSQPTVQQTNASGYSQFGNSLLSVSQQSTVKLGTAHVNLN